MCLVKRSTNHSDDVIDFEIDIRNETNCPTFKREQMIFIHFSAVFTNRKASYTQLSPLLKDYPYVTLDTYLINGFDQGNA